LGQGTALVRIGRNNSETRFRAPPPLASGDADGIRITRRPDAQPITPGPKEWKYLESRAFATRYVLAAHFVRACRFVIEVGGSATATDHFLTGAHDGVLVLDPLARERSADVLNGRPCSVAHVRARFQDVDWHIPAGADYGLVMLGLEIQGLEP